MIYFYHNYCFSILHLITNFHIVLCKLFYFELSFDKCSYCINLSKQVNDLFAKRSLLNIDKLLMKVIISDYF